MIRSHSRVTSRCSNFSNDQSITCRLPLIGYPTHLIMVFAWYLTTTRRKGSSSLDSGSMNKLHILLAQLEDLLEVQSATQVAFVTANDDAKGMTVTLTSAELPIDL
jgi:hypothetical protein